jgi:hypothetical protein
MRRQYRIAGSVSWAAEKMVSHATKGSVISEGIPRGIEGVNND